MTKTILLHVGVPKTGTSTIQYLTAKHSRYLAERGIHYPVYSHEISEPNGTVYFETGNAREFSELLPAAALGNITSLHESLSTRFADRIRSCTPPAADAFFFSCELISLMDEFRLTVVKNVFQDLWPNEEIKFRPLLVVRNLLDHGKSWWRHLVRRHGEQLSLDEFLSIHYDPPHLQAADDLARVFGHENLIVVKHMPAPTVLKISMEQIGIKLSAAFDDLFQDRKLHVSLAPNHLEALRQCLPLLPEGSWKTNFEGTRGENELYWALGDLLEGAMTSPPDKPPSGFAISEMTKRALHKKFDERLSDFNHKYPPIGGPLEIGDSSSIGVSSTSNSDEPNSWVLLVKELAANMMRNMPQFEAQRQRVEFAEMVRRSGIFDEKYYLEQIAKKRSTGLGSALAPELALSHFVQEGWKYGLRPSPYFDPLWYANHHSIPDNPIDHYIRYGASEGRQPCPEIPAQIAFDYRYAGNIPSLLSGTTKKLLDNILLSKH